MGGLTTSDRLMRESPGFKIRPFSVLVLHAKRKPDKRYWQLVYANSFADEIELHQICLGHGAGTYKVLRRENRTDGNLTADCQIWKKRRMERSE